MMVKFGFYEDMIKSGTGLYDYTQFHEAEVKEWMVKPGDVVKKGDSVTRVDSEKAELELAVLCDGTIVSLNYDEGEKWYQGDTEDTPLGRLVLPELGIMEVACELESPAKPQVRESFGAAISRLSPLAEKFADANNVLRKDVENAYPDKRRIEKEDVEVFLKRKAEIPLQKEESPQPYVRADPAARRRARELNIGLSRVPPSHEDRKIRVEDVERHAASLASQHAEGDDKESAASSIDRIITVVPASEMRKTIARYMTKSWTIPHAGDEVTIDTTQLVRYRDTIKELWKNVYGSDLKYDHFFMYFAAKNLLHDEFKIINAYWNDETQCIHYLSHVNLGIAVQRPAEQGLLVPVVHHADTMTFVELVKNVNDKVTRAISGKLTIADMRDLSFTLNRVAFRDEKTGRVIGGEHPHALIPWTRDTNGSLEGRSTSMIISLSKMMKKGNRTFLRVISRFDHRLFDAGPPIRFLDALKDFIENSKFSDVVIK